MSQSTKPWWARCAAKVTAGAITALTSLTRRLGAPTLIGVPVSAAILTQIAAVSPQQPLDEVAQLFVAGRHAHLPVVEDGKAVSVITRSDIAAGLASVGPHASVADAPSHHVVAVTPNDSLAQVLERLHETPHSVAVVVAHGAPVGVLTAESVAAYLDDVARRTV
jgi:CBS domain-containing protein